MQQIERYGVIALVFLLVTIVAISFWGDSKSPGFWSRLTGKNQPKEVAKIETPVLPPQISDPSLPTSPAAPIDVPQAVGSLGGPAPMTTIDQPATGLTTVQPPDATVAFGAQQPPLGSPAGAAPVQPMPQPHVVTPPAAPAANSAANSATNEYVVQRGDSLARIARNRLGAESRWQEIAALNPKIDPKSLDVGQKILLPEGAAPAVAKSSTPSSAAPKPAAKPAAKTATKSVVASAAPKTSDKSAAAGRACIVQKGDTLRSIARRELGDERRWKEIASANPGLDPAKLAIGMRVKLPQKGAELLAAAGPAPSSSSSSKPRVR